MDFNKKISLKSFLAYLIANKLRHIRIREEMGNFGYVIYFYSSRKKYLAFRISDHEVEKQSDYKGGDKHGKKTNSKAVSSTKKIRSNGKS